MPVLEVTDYIRIDSKLHVQTFFKGALVQLPKLFRQEIIVCMLKNIPDCLQSQKKLHCSVFEEIHEHSFFFFKKKKKRIYSGNIIWCTLLLRYTSIQSYKMLLEDFPLPSLSLLSKINKRKIDAIKYTQALKKDDKISYDICLLFDDIQKCEDYLGGELIGSDENGELDKAIVCFMLE